ncbi:NADH-ubiquinone oxidoreductase 17.8 kDa subunit-like protein [Hapsidospora chrysogenum ATCC 11550]|uniref:NADH-ubiquinone oxidoreductase 17.8 kDa subunit-like protein n=1 Tax=Hapsidospora chrysogenum (strain ATCC 11550 / CBS 779.69 / DSM 880 / IAM 14645 / JCM 23072 / IMI 49137) TaxID=857340 RepID=A0A086TFC8_HAPC1|nr:NADH-ubiquinone oxidoreductase 17.8 kDa subunit-like protein [Hapsidospora chrysogenum ATCC 11550]
MFAARQRASCLARQLQRASRNYASDAHAQHKPVEVNESFGKGSIFAVATFFGGVLLYQVSPKEGQSSGLTNLITSWTSRPEHWEEINTAHALAVKQAGFDRTLFEHSPTKDRPVEVAYPEALQSHCSRNIRAGHIANIDHVIEHYRQEHLKEEDRKLKKLAECN